MHRFNLSSISRPPILLVHCAAAAASLYYAWLISQSAYVKTGLQFVTPLLVIMAVHLCWIAVSRRMQRGFALEVFRRTAQTSVVMALVLALGSFIAPQPAAADGMDVVGSLLTVVFCVAIIVAIAAVLAAIGYLLIKGVLKIIDALSGVNNDKPDTRLFDFGSLAVAAGVLCLCSLEGLPHFYSFNASTRAEAVRVIDASPDKVWATMGTATQPSFALPEVLSVFPQPVDVVVDEGVGLGAKRKVKFKGREGTGYLSLQVVERTPTRVVFQVLSDSSPIARWLKHQTLTYSVSADGQGTRLSVSLEYDRLLAPSWFFTPVTKGAAYLAMDVLARDVTARAES